MKFTIFVIGILLTAVALWIAGQYWYVNYKIEKPKYTIVSKHKGYEVREYAPYIVASATVKDNGRALSSGFGIVADYIFGNNTTRSGVAMTSPVIEERTNENIAMTTPVVDEPSADGTRTISFIMPSKYTLETLPKPNNDNISISEIPAQKWAVLTYRGWASESDLAGKLTELQSYLNRDGVEYTDQWQSVRYDPPSTPPFLRTNEIWVKLP